MSVLLFMAPGGAQCSRSDRARPVGAASGASREWGMTASVDALSRSSGPVGPARVLGALDAPRRCAARALCALCGVDRRHGAADGQRVPPASFPSLELGCRRRPPGCLHRPLLPLRVCLRGRLHLPSRSWSWPYPAPSRVRASVPARPWDRSRVLAQSGRVRSCREAGFEPCATARPVRVPVVRSVRGLAGSVSAACVRAPRRCVAYGVVSGAPSACPITAWRCARTAYPARAHPCARGAARRSLLPPTLRARACEGRACRVAGLSEPGLDSVMACHGLFHPRAAQPAGGSERAPAVQSREPWRTAGARSGDRDSRSAPPGRRSESKSTRQGRFGPERAYYIAPND